MQRHGMAMFLIALLLATLATGCGGGTQSTPVREEPFTSRPFQPATAERGVNAVCYGPHRDGQRPGGPDPSTAEIREDLQLMLPHWNLLRIYGSRGPAETILRVIREDRLDMKVMLGAWIAPDAAEANRLEVDAAIELANKYNDIVLAISVGNETQVSWSAHRSSLPLLIDHVRRVRASTTVPVTVADDFNFWNKGESQPLAAELDFITMHAHPMWNGLQLTGALKWLSDQRDAVQALHPHHLVVIGETGWATSVHDEGEQAELIKGSPGEMEQKSFHHLLRSWTAAEGFTVFLFEAFDENWKGGSHPNEVEKHWGLFNADRTPKAALASDTGK